MKESKTGITVSASISIVVKAGRMVIRIRFCSSVHVRSLCDPACQDPLCIYVQGASKNFDPVRAVRGASFPVRT